MGGGLLIVQIDWPEYCRVHSRRANLLIHLFAVPLFVAAVASLIGFILRGDLVSAVIALAFAFLAMAAQGRGHKTETTPPRPFRGPANFLRRWFTEQFVIFPLFFFTGRWWRQWNCAVKNNES
jgi:hypothetical protein